MVLPNSIAPALLTTPPYHPPSIWRILAETKSNYLAAGVWLISRQEPGQKTESVIVAFRMQPPCNPADKRETRNRKSQSGSQKKENRRLGQLAIFSSWQFSAVSQFFQFFNRFVLSGDKSQWDKVFMIWFNGYLDRGT